MKESTALDSRRVAIATTFPMESCKRRSTTTPRVDEMQTISLERYPELLFLLHYTPFTPLDLFKSADGLFNASSEKEGPLHADLISHEIERFVSQRDLNSIDIFYLYGIGMGHHYVALKG